MNDKMRGRRSPKQIKRWIRRYERYRELHKLLRKEAADILDSENFITTKSFIQHGNITVNTHCMNVAKYSVALSDKLHIPCNRRELVRGALLHDYFLYDWHDKDHVKIQNLHGFYHPGIALRNANKEFKLTDREKDIIRKHMWPMTVVPPVYREGWLVTTADKWCSLLETIHIHKGHGAVAKRER